MDKVAVIILNYNGRHFLEKFLPGIVQYNEGYPIYVVDNQSTDQSLDFLASSYSKEVNCIKLERNFGFAGGYNKAVNHIEAEYYIFLNSDIEVTEGWIKPLVSLMESNQIIAACQPKLLDFKERNRFEYAGAAGGYIDLLGYPFCRGRVFQTMEKDYGQYDDIIPVFWASGACMMIRSTVFKDLGGFDEDYFAHMEEIDLCWRIKRSGFEVYYNGESILYHVGGGTLNESNPFKTYLNFRNSLITLIKNDNSFALLWKVPARLTFDIIASLKFLISDSLRDAFSVVRADLHVITRVLYYFKKRGKLQKINTKYTGWYNRSIVISYYFLRRKFFFNLKSIVPDHIIPSP
jgi:GT2 family glycosyltransferase